MKNNSFKLMATLLLCASTEQLISEQSIDQFNLITVNDLKNDITYIDEFLTTAHKMHSVLLPEEIALIEHDLFHIDKYLSGYRDRSDLLQIMNIVKQKFIKAQETEKILKDLESPKESSETEPLQKKIPTILIKRVTKQAAPQLTKKQGKKEEKTSLVKTQKSKNKRNKDEEFAGLLSSPSSSSDRTVPQPEVIHLKPYRDPRIVQLMQDIEKRQTLFREETKNIPNIIITNNTDQTLVIEYISIGGRQRRQVVAPGQKSYSINRNNIKSLSYYRPNASSANAVDISKIYKKAFLTIKSSIYPVLGEFFNLEEQRESA